MVHSCGDKGGCPRREDFLRPHGVQSQKYYTMTAICHPCAEEPRIGSCSYTIKESAPEHCFAPATGCLITTPGEACRSQLHNYCACTWGQRSHAESRAFSRHLHNHCASDGGRLPRDGQGHRALQQGRAAGRGCLSGRAMHGHGMVGLGGGGAQSAQRLWYKWRRHWRRAGELSRGCQQTCT